MNIEWYPGHMTDAMRRIDKDIQLVDLIIEILDARIPESSQNPVLHNKFSNKKKIIVMNKSDLADPAVTKAWTDKYFNQNISVIEMDSRRTKDTGKVKKAALDVLKEKRERDKARGIAERPVKAMVVGIPNVGKSTFINSFVGKASAKTGDKPGVTRGNQWIRISKDINLLDTPGVLWPKFEDQNTGIRLAITGSIADHVFDEIEISIKYLDYIKKYYYNLFDARYQLNDISDMSGYEILQEVACKKNLLIKGGEPDLSRAAHMLLQDFRSGRMGRITLERPNM